MQSHIIIKSIFYAAFYENIRKYFDYRKIYESDYQGLGTVYETGM